MDRSPGRRATYVASATYLFVQIALGSLVAHSAEAVPEPEAYRLEDYRKPVPATLKGARGVLSVGDAKKLHDAGAIFLDVYPQAPKPPNLPSSTVWRQPKHPSIAGAIWLPNVGYGVLSEQARSYFETHLTQFTLNDKAKPLVFFCLRDCWMSWNAAKRAIALGYSSVYWFPDGTDAWEEGGYPTTVLTPTP
ncbi:MAG: PQQ-dependent catabolism-associated CXXCW motif protein [Hyphomicrobiaceae bacterium]